MTKEEKKEYDRQRYLEKKEHILEHQKQYNQKNKEKRLEYNRQYRQENKEKIKQYLKDNRAKINERTKMYRKTPVGRANYLLTDYRRLDKNANRGECTLTVEWIIENIFSKPCHYCGETNWLKIGCDRIDNNLPHTLDNVVPCCHRCNAKRKKMTYDNFVKLWKIS